MKMKFPPVLNTSTYDADFICWNPSFNTGIVMIDEQHKKLVELCNNFYKAIIQNQKNENWHELLKSTLKECVDYVNKHFKDEEKLMRSASFSGFAKHKNQHDVFTEKVRETVISFNEITVAEAIGFTKFLYDWILSHIANEDKLYIPTLIEYLKASKS